MASAGTPRQWPKEKPLFGVQHGPMAIGPLKAILGAFQRRISRQPFCDAVLLALRFHSLLADVAVSALCLQMNSPN